MTVAIMFSLVIWIFIATILGWSKDILRGKGHCLLGKKAGLILLWTILSDKLSKNWNSPQLEGRPHCNWGQMEKKWSRCFPNGFSIFSLLFTFYSSHDPPQSEQRLQGMETRNDSIANEVWRRPRPFFPCQVWTLTQILLLQEKKSYLNS